VLSRVLIMVLVALSFAVPQVSAMNAGIAVIVNDGAISASDVNDRLRLIMVSSGLPDNEDVRQKLIPQIVNSLIEEELKFQEAAREDIQVSPADVDAGFVQLAKQNNLEPEKFKDVLKNSGVSFKTMERQISAQLAWTGVVQKKLRSRVVVSQQDIDGFITRLEGIIGTPEYLLAEIFLPVGGEVKEKDAQAFAGKLSREIRQKKVPFFRMAQQFSKAPGAAQGGNLGWIQEDQLSEDFVDPVKAMKKDNVSDPIQSARGYHLLFLRDRRVITQESIPSRKDVEAIIGTQRLERSQARLLMDLKASAFIENRV